ncbi:MAG: hypothetical protein WKF53_16935 [Rubrobacter sp.]
MRRTRIAFGMAGGAPTPIRRPQPRGQKRASEYASVSALGFLDDIHRVGQELKGRLNAATEAVGDWAGGETGQQVLTALDFVTLSSEIGDYYAHIGWYFPVHGALHRYVLEHIRHNVPFDARSAAKLVGPTSVHWQWIVEGLRSSPCVETRSPIVEDAIYCLEHERWHAAVCSLLPVVEGIISDRAGVLSGMRVGKRFTKLLHEEEGELTALSAIPALSVLDKEVFTRQEFADVELAETALNRHLVLHGRTVSFGSEVNGCKLFMLLVALVELLDGVLLLRSDTAPGDTASFLDEYGPLAGLRATARSRRELGHPR